MPMGIVGPSDFQIELARLKIEVPKEPEVIDIEKGRGNTKEVPEIVRETIAKCAINGEGTGEQIAEAFGVSPSSVSAYKVGATSTDSYRNPDPSLLDSITSHKNKISRKARNRLIRALENITTDKLESAKALELSVIARNMSSVVKDMEPPAAINLSNQNNVQFVFMAPKVKNEDTYPTLVVDD